MRRYYPLEDFLRKARQDRVELTFSQIEKLLSFPLPQKAISERRWWENNPFKPSYKPKPWQNVEFSVKEVDMINGVIVFLRDDHEQHK